MKKILIALFFVLPSIAFATSGACSDHGGVDCAAGMGASGNVICNDGWTGSSVSYSSMEECADTSAQTPMCTAAQYQTLLSNSALVEAKSEVQSDANQIQFLETEAGSITQDDLSSIQASGGVVDESQFEAEVNNDKQGTQTQIADFTSAEAAAQAKVDQLTEQANEACKNMGIAEMSTQTTNTEANNASANPVPVASVAPVQAPTLQTSSSNQTTSTLCLSGSVYDLATKSCVSKDTECLSVWGAHTHPASASSDTDFSKMSGCDCDSGYVWVNPKNSTDMCIPISQAKLQVGANATNTESSTSSIEALLVSKNNPSNPTPWYDWLSWLNPFSWFKKFL